MRGEIDFEPALRERVALLKDLPVGVVERGASQDRITADSGGRGAGPDHARPTAPVTGLVSGGFTLFTGRGQPP